MDLKTQKYEHVLVFTSLFRINLNKEAGDEINYLKKNNMKNKKNEMNVLK